MYDVFLSHPHTHADWVEKLAIRLKDEHNLQVWLDKWVLVPGENFIPKIAKGLEEAATCAICVGKDTLRGWVQLELQKALNRRTKDETFRVIPVLMPDSAEESINDFLELQTWVDFRRDEAEALHRLVCGIKGKPPGRWLPANQDVVSDPTERKLRKLASFRHLVHDTTILELERDLLREALANV